MLFQAGSKAVVMLEWKINQQLITEKYCVNKENPMMHCDGKCYLAKQLRKLEMEEQKERSKHPFPSGKLKQAEMAFVCPQVVRMLFSAEIQKTVEQAYAGPNNQYSFDFQNYCFHPPDFVA